ncbi:hypothetical protein ACHAW5_007918 [Stephanodiscus triporus]|uniref:Uncharacterized protein n=1 Tax=Stephanodiscus triporus TaxID=2934178 RepID=A0ABD3MW47_9STRA
MGAAVDVPFCADALAGSDIADPCHVQINRLEHDNEKIGYDVSSARGWMEHIEQCDGQLYGVGAYTVIRCDASYTKHTCNWKIWGLDFHTSRLWSSYRMLIESLGSDFDENTDEKEITRRTVRVINALLDEATLSLLEESMEDIHQLDLEDEHLTRTLMLTVLWTPSRKDADFKESESTQPIIVRGHAIFAGASRAQNCKEDSLPSPIAACIAVPSDPTAEEMSLLPHRHRNDSCLQIQSTHFVGAMAKISSWCRSRRPLEDSNRFKVPGSGVGEVLLVGRARNRAFDGKQNFIDSLEVLEGLITNFFVIYKDGTVRTAPLPKVLPGFVRHLVLDVVNEVQELVLDDLAPTVQDAKDGLWSEVFVTSAIKIIVPVNRVLIPPTGGMESITLWQSDCRELSDYPFTQLIRSELIKRGGDGAHSLKR